MICVWTYKHHKIILYSDTVGHSATRMQPFNPHRWLQNFQNHWNKNWHFGYVVTAGYLYLKKSSVDMWSLLRSPWTHKTDIGWQNDQNRVRLHKTVTSKGSTQLGSLPWESTQPLPIPVPSRPHLDQPIHHRKGCYLRHIALVIPFVEVCRWNMFFMTKQAEA